MVSMMICTEYIICSRDLETVLRSLARLVCGLTEMYEKLTCHKIIEIKYYKKIFPM
jgi:hypothetical protein